MDSFKKYFIKPWNSTAILSQDPLPRFVWEHLLKVYCTLGYTLGSALLGAFSHVYFDIGGWVTAVGFIGSLYWMSRINPWRQGCEASHLFGSTIGPAINLIFQVNQSFIIKIIMGAIVVCCCYFRAAIHSEDRCIIYEIGDFSTPIFITTWMIIYETYPGLLAHSLFLAFLPLPWYPVVSTLKFCRNKLQIWLNFPVHVTWVAFLCYCFNYSFDDLVFVYVLVLALLSYMKIFCQEVLYIAVHHANECYSVDTAITFFTEFFARTMSLIIHNVSLMVKDIRRFLRWRVIDDHAYDIE